MWKYVYGGASNVGIGYKFDRNLAIGVCRFIGMVFQLCERNMLWVGKLFELLVPEFMSLFNNKAQTLTSNVIIRLDLECIAYYDNIEYSWNIFGICWNKPAESRQSLTLAG